MQVTRDNVNIYNLSCGKSMPGWLSQKYLRKLAKRDVDYRRRIDLIQDFTMPDFSNCITMTKDGNFIIAAGMYKPRLRCYDVNNLSMKFERCFDAECYKIEMLSDDYSKFAMLQCDRWVEIHTRPGFYYKLRIPKFGRDLVYHKESCDLLLIGHGPDIYRLNLERGRFLNTLTTKASALKRIAVHEGYDFFACGTIEGKVESWDPRMRQSISTLDCVPFCTADNTLTGEGFPEVTALKFKGDLTMAVGTYTGQVLLYDIRARKPFMVKDHSYGTEIKSIEFIEGEELVASMDEKCVKFWRQNTGQNYTTVVSSTGLNDLCVVPKSGLFFMANEDTKILSYFIPSIGPAPRWCCFLDAITEELQENKQDTVYDDYKFVTTRELEQLHLEHLIGTNLLRAYMHGYFMDVRLYNKANKIVQPEAYKELKQKMVRTRIEKERNTKKIVVKELPNVNRGYARKLMEKKVDNKMTTTPFEDERFKAMFDNPDFEMKETDEEYVRIKNTMEKDNKSTVELVAEGEIYNPFEDENEVHHDSQSSSDDDDEESADDEEQTTENEKKKKKKKGFKAYDSDAFSMLKKGNDKAMVPLEERLRALASSSQQRSWVSGNKDFSYAMEKKDESKKWKQRVVDQETHLKERRKCRRPAERKFLRD